MRIGDCVLVTFPGELFAEVGLRIKEQSPFEFTFVAGYSNGAVGYAPTADAYDGEAYEDMLSQLPPQWQAVYEAKARAIIARLGSPGPGHAARGSTPPRPTGRAATTWPEHPASP